MKNKARQTCTTCPCQSKCWPVTTNKGKSVSTQNILINILVCRLQSGIHPNEAAANLLQLFRPGMIRLLTHARQNTNNSNMDMDQLLSDMQSTTIEYLLRDYKIGDRGRATPYLFDPHQGFLTKWVMWITGKNNRFYSHHELYSMGENHNSDDSEYADYAMSTASHGGVNDNWSALLEGGDSLRYDPYNDGSLTNNLGQRVTDIIDDGITLNSNEYRVIKFCLSNANEANSTRHIDGLHIYLANLMGVSRPRITRLYKRATDKIKKRYSEITADEDNV